MFIEAVANVSLKRKQARQLPFVSGSARSKRLKSTHGGVILRWILVKFVPSCLVLLIANQTAFADSSVEKSTPSEVVRVAQFGQSKFLLYLPLYVAMEEGYFEKLGLQVDLMFAGNDDQVFATLISKSADFAVGDPLFTAIAAERGLSTKTVGLMIRKLAVFGYTNSARVPEIRSIADLKGLRLGTFPAPSTTFTFLKEIQNQIGSNNPLQLVEGAHGTMLAMLTAGVVDIAVDLEPTVSIVEDQGKRVVFDLTKFSQAQAITGLMTTSELINKNPSIVRKMVAGLQEALTALSRHPDVALRVAEKLFPEISSKILARAIDRVLTSGCYPLNADIDDADWQRSIRTRLESGDLKAPQETSVAVDNSFALATQEVHK